jgi:predicted transcriptional regulator
MKKFFYTLSVHINPEQVAWLDDYGARTNQTRSQITRNAIAQMQLKDQIVQRRVVSTDA